MSPNSLSAVAPTRSFYKIMLPSIINDHKLRIPDDFAKIYENDLSSYATLVVPNGRVFRVRVEKTKKMIWLHNGWKRFAEYHSIRCGFFLVFEYEGNSKFKVYIFDLTATEIKYPKNSFSTCEDREFGNKGKVLQKRGRNSSSTSTPGPKPVFSKDDFFTGCLQRGEKRKMCFHSVLPAVFEFAPEFAKRISTYGECMFYKPFFENLRYNCQHKTRNKRFKVEGIGEMNMLKNVTPRQGTSKAIVLYKSRIESENDEIVLENYENHESLVDNSNGSELEKNIESEDDDFIPKNQENLVEIPSESELEQNIVSENDEFILENHENLLQDSSFPNESELKNHTCSADKKGHLSAEDTHLATPINKDEDRVNVKQEEGGGFIGVNNSGNLLRRLRVQEKQKAVNDALMLKLKNPYFMIILKQYNVDRTSILHVPVYFGKKYLSSDTQFLKLEGPDGKHCKVSCLANSEVQYLGRGWAEFANENCLLDGDVCIFELIQVDDVVLKVHLFRTCQTSLY